MSIRLENEIKAKQEEIERTIQHAGEAYYKKNEAEELLRNLDLQTDDQKTKFFKELKEINGKIDEGKDFQEFIFSKNKEKKELDQLEIAIVKNQKKIEEKRRHNAL